ncbi:MAG: hypothetical protein Q9227_001712 [Pyrenula ochraceoflavens]
MAVSEPDDMTMISGGNEGSALRSQSGACEQVRSEKMGDGDADNCGSCDNQRGAMERYEGAELSSSCGGKCCADGEGHDDATACCSGEVEKVNGEENCEEICCSGDSKGKEKESGGKNNTGSVNLCCPGEASRGEKDGCRDACCDGADTSAVEDEESCQDACCSDDEQKAVEVEDSCQDACCSGEKAAREEAGEEGCCDSEDIEASKGNNDDNCCTSNEDSNQETCEDQCCANENANPRKLDSNDCCSTPASKPNYQTSPSACRQRKATPCCDASCVDRIAIRECKSDCGKDQTSTHRSGMKRGTACADHKKRTFEKYAAKLAALECICRALIALGQESCCVGREGSFTQRRRGGSKLARGTRSKEDTRRSEGTVNGQQKTESSVQGSTCRRGCCKSENICPSKSRGSVTAKTTGKFSSENDSISVIHTQSGYVDVEKGNYGIEHIALSITGMTCTGCETKVQRVLGTLPPITNLKTSLVMARAEFSLDTASMSSESVIKHLERTTEFKCKQISTQGSNLDVIPSNVKDFLSQPLPLGISDVQLVDKDVVRINFDPKIIGARSLIGKNAKHPCKLAPPPTDPGLAAGSRHVQNMGYITLFSIALTIPVLVLAWAPIKDRPVPYGGVSLALATTIQIVVAGPFYPKALKSLIFSRVIEMDLLIVLSTSAAYIFSVISFGYLASGKPLSTGEFFETSTLLVTLIMFGRWVAALSRQKAVESISIRSLQSSTAQLVTEAGTDGEEIDTRLLEYGDIFSVLPEHRVPTDGVVISGSSEIDESMLTGESRLIAKEASSSIIAGSINGSGKLIARMTHLPGENTVSVIAGMVDNAKLSKPKIQDLADRAAAYFVPLIVCLTMVTFVVWIGVGVAIQHKSGSDAAIQAITYAITVLIVSCPCAIGLAVPMVIVIGSSVAAERGIIFKSADSIEIAYKATHVVFDKTGTLTTGKLAVVEKHYIGEDSSTQRATILGLIANSKHPVSAAVATHLTKQSVSAAQIHEIKTVPGKGIEGKIDGKSVRAGNPHWLEVDSDPHVQSIQDQQRLTLLCVTLDSKLLAVFGLADTIRPEAAATIAMLKQNGIHVSLLSGDDAGAVQYVAKQIGLDPGNEAQARCSPGDKQKHIQDLLAEPSFSSKSKKAKKPTVIFVGDGTNDAVALAQASIGVHMNPSDSTTDAAIAQSAASVVLMRPSLSSVLTMVSISRAAVLRIKFNFAWSFVYNVAALLFASGALVGKSSTSIRIPPQYAGLGELVSVLPVIAVAVGLRWSRFGDAAAEGTVGI